MINTMDYETISHLPKVPRPELRPARTLVPIMPVGDNESLLTLAHQLAVTEPVLLLGIVPVPEGENLTAGTGPARELRRLIQAHVDRVNLRAKPRIRVSYSPWDDIRTAISEEESIRLLILDYEHHLTALRLTAAEILSHPPCDVAIMRGPVGRTLQKILVYNRGGPHAERALELGLTVARPSQAIVTALTIVAEEATQRHQEALAGISQVLAAMPDVEQQQIVSNDEAGTLVQVLKDYDLVVLGTTAYPTESTVSFGAIADQVIRQSQAAVIGVKTKRVVPETALAGQFGGQAISVLVDRWFAENTFHSDEFSDLQNLVHLKEDTGLTISVALPSLNEEETVGDIIYSIQRTLMEQFPLVDELVLVDSNSKDRTREIAADFGIPVYIHQELLPQYGARHGKGEALWKSLYVTEGDLIIWVDTDIKNFHPRFVYGLVGPLLQREKLMLVKGFYRRPLRTSTGLQPGRGGRVTELTARPLLNLFYPELSGIIQPLSGEYGGRREALEQMVFTSGYGVETSLLIEAFERFTLKAIAQVDLVERIHRNQGLTDLSKMAFAIIQTVFSKLEKRYGRAMLQDINRTMKIVRYEKGLYKLEVEEIAEFERPPMIEIPEYRQKRGPPSPEISEPDALHHPHPSR